MKIILLSFLSFLGLIPATLFASASELETMVYQLAGNRMSGRAPGTSGHKMAQEYIREKLGNLGIEVQLQQVSLGQKRPPIKNLYAKWEGKNKGKTCVVFMAHYDHVGEKEERVYPGAMDNAAGVASLLSLAQKLKEHPIDLEADIYFSFPDYEEKQLRGSFHFVPFLKTKCGQILFNVTLDVVGAKFFPGMEGRILALGSESSLDFEQILPDKKSPDFHVERGHVYIIEPFGIPRSDYANFRLHGIPFVFLTNGTPFYYHKPKDTPDRIDYDHLKKITDYLYESLQNFQQNETDLKFRFVWRPDPKVKENAQKLAQVLDLLLDNKNKNQLTEEEVIKFTAHRNQLGGSEESKPRVQHIHKAIIDLLKTVSGKDLDKQ